MTPGQYDSLGIEINASATSVDFYVNGTLRATTTTNIPRTVPVGLGSFILKSAGTKSRSVLLDYIEAEIALTIPR